MGLLDGILPYLYQRSDALKRQIGGLLSDPVGVMQQAAGQLVDSHNAQQGLLGKAFANPKKPFEVTDQNALAQAADNMLTGPLGMAPAGITVWHGSPHKFDRFDSSKIGTGEGAQAYGYGLYLAESPAVAKDYAGALSAARANKPVGNVDLQQVYQSLPHDVPETLLAARRDFRALNDAGELSLADRRDFLDAVKRNITAAKGGSLYKVDLPDPAVAKMLDWDKPISEQPQAVREALAKLPKEWVTNSGGQRQFIDPVMSRRTGGGLLEELKMLRRGQPEELLRQQGITGIQYLDGGSRGAGTGTRNFVVFPGEESLLTILERNGVPLR